MTAKVVLDSISPEGDRLTTLEVRMHRFVLAEFNTHRVFSRNSASSRAIPVEKRIRQLWEDPARPISWPREQSGMQGGEELTGSDLADARLLWSNIEEHVLVEVSRYIETHDPEDRLHKSVLNRLLEPFMWHTVVVTSTEWENFFEQRCSPLAQPEIRAAADKMSLAMLASTPCPLERMEWHTPYIQADEYEDMDEIDRIKVSVARCARVSYLTQDGVRDIRKDLELFDRLSSADPPHWSPLEHVARPALVTDKVLGNFRGWHQLRHLW
jgi:hypothetical protein